MPLSRSRDYLSIGEVLDSIRPEFPDVSISKIRFLEAEGLITPERTPSGYRKFYEGDVARLRYILGLQRDHFMPLKVIRERLEEADSNGGRYPQSPTTPPVAEPAGGDPAPTAIETDVALDHGELLRASGLEEVQFRGLVEFGILADRGERSFDGNDLAVARAAHKLFQFGVEPRHLRMYRQMAEREANFIEQIVAPTLKRKDPSAPSSAARAARELTELSRRVREALLRSALDELL
ncbi:MAG: transcriptional regulator FtsR [Actinomycetota bacterium]